jgi:hypothetical protein
MSAASGSASPDPVAQRMYCRAGIPQARNGAATAIPSGMFGDVMQRNGQRQQQPQVRLRDVRGAHGQTLGDVVQRQRGKEHHTPAVGHRIGANKPQRLVLVRQIAVQRKEHRCTRANAQQGDPQAAGCKGLVDQADGGDGGHNTGGKAQQRIVLAHPHARKEGDHRTAHARGQSGQQA